MANKIKVSGYRRSRPVSDKMKEFLDSLGGRRQVEVKPHERKFTKRKRKEEDNEGSN